MVGALLGLMSERDAEGRVFNVGAQSEISIGELAQRIIEVTGSTSEIVRVPYDEAYEAGFEDMQRRRPSTKRINELMGWSPTRDLETIFKDVAADIEGRLSA